MKKNLVPTLLFTAAVLFLFFFLLNKIPLWSSDEGRYGEIAREMWESKNFIIPTFNYTEYLEKPILGPWAAAFSFALFGVSHMTARFPSVFSAILGILFTVLFTRRLFDDRTAKIAGLVLLTSLGYVLVGRFAVLDMQMLFLLSMSVFFLMTGLFEGRRRFYLGSYVFMALAVLTKGLIGVVLPGLIVLAYLLWSRRLSEIPKMYPVRGLLILTVIIAPWVMAIMRFEADFLRYFILEHHFSRFATGEFGRSRPFWFFSYVFLIIAFPWSLLVPAAIAKGLSPGGVYREKIKFLICWIGVILVFFSIPRSKLPYYIVPVCIPLAVLVALRLSAWFEEKTPDPEQRLLARSWGLIGVVCILGGLALVIACLVPGVPEIDALRSTFMISSVILTAGGIACLRALRKGRKRRIFFSVWAMTYVLFLVIITGMVRMTPLESTYAFAAELLPRLKAGDHVAIYSSPDHFSDFPFHLRQRVIVIGTNRGTLAHESLEEEHAKASEEWFWTEDRFRREFREGAGTVYCLLDSEHLDRLLGQESRNAPIVKENSGKVLITNRPRS